MIRVDESEKKPLLYFKNNLEDGIILLEAMREFKINKIIFASSAAVYGPNSRKLSDENHLKNPSSVYGLTKILFENILRFYSQNYGVDCTIFRIFNVAGTDPSGNLKECHKPETHLIPKTLEALNKGKPVIICGNNYDTPDGTCLRDFIHVNDVSAAFLSAIALSSDKNLFQVFNLGLGKAYSVKEVVELCSELTGKKTKIVFTEKRAGDSAVLVSNSDKARKLLNWNPKYNLKNMIIHTIKSLS